MDIKKFLLGSVGGGIAFFLLGWVFYGMLLMGFFEAQHIGPEGVMKEEGEMVWWALILGNIFQAALLSYIFLKWASISTFVGGLKGGVVIGLLLGLGMALVWYATGNFMTLTGHLVDVVVTAVMYGIAGGVVGWILGMGSNKTA